MHQYLCCYTHHMDTKLLEARGHIGKTSQKCFLLELSLVETTATGMQHLNDNEQKVMMEHRRLSLLCL